MTCNPAHLLVLPLASLLACAHWHPWDCKCERRASDLVSAITAAAAVVQSKTDCFAGFGEPQLRALVRQSNLMDWQKDVIDSVDLKVGPNETCDGAIVIALCHRTQAPVLWDDTSTTVRVEEPDLLHKPANPPKLPTPDCKCGAATSSAPPGVAP
jgi:hypothetical protein